MKRITKLVLFVGVLLSFAFSIPNAQAKLKIGFVLSTMQEERYQKDKAIFEKTAQNLGAEVVFASCNNNEQTQAAQVDNLLSQGVQTLVLQPVNGDTASGLVKQAKEDGVAVIAYDRLIRNAPIDFYITEDSERVGELQAEAAVRYTGAKGNYVLLMGQAGHSVAEARTRGVLKVLSKYPAIKIVVQQNHHAWSPNLAMTTVENALARFHNNIQAILANNSGMAHGAIQALTEQKLAGKIFVAGADADLTAIRDVVAGKQQFEVFISITDMAERAAKTAVALAQHQTPDSTSTVDNGAGKIRTMNTPVFAVTKQTVDQQIIATGFHTKKAIYGN